MTKSEAEKMFKADVHDLAALVDPDNEQDWYSLTLGYFIGKGEDPESAHDLALYIRYHTDLG